MNTKTMKQNKYNIEALISDVDRTLLDTEDFIYQAFSHTLKKYNLPPVTQAKLNPLMGKPLEECYKILAPDLDSDKLCNTHRSFQEKNLHLAKPFPNTIPTLKKLKKMGIKIAAVTTRSNRTSHDTLKVSGILPYIDVVISKEDLHPGELKPHPRPVLLALEKLKVKASDAFMMGDALEDIASGKNAGTKTIGVTYGSAGSMINKGHPDYIINDISEVVTIFM
jgi:pyrophosphatase PpaX